MNSMLVRFNFTNIVCSTVRFQKKVIELHSDIFEYDEDFWYTATLNDSLRFITFDDPGKA